MVEISRTIGEENLHILTDAVFRSKKEDEVFKLSSILPQGYVILEEAEKGCEFMLSGSAAVIVVSPGFLESLGGRISFLHELGHVYDYEKKPKSRDELIKSVKDIHLKEREENAWEAAKNIVKSLRARGINFLPESLGEFEENSAWNEIAKECVGHHNYQTGEVKKFVTERDAGKEKEK